MAHAHPLPAGRCPDIPVIETGACPPRDACEGLAQTYYEVIRSKGQESFDSNQAEAEKHAQECEAQAAAP